MIDSEPKFHFYQWVRYKNQLIPYLVLRVSEKSKTDEIEYAIIRIDKQTKFLTEEERTFEEIIRYGFDIKYRVKEKHLNSYF